MTEISGTRTLHRLIYISRQRPMADIDVEIASIIHASIRNNRDVAITGLLLIHQDYFIQALEGPAEAVLRTYGRIVNDPRHEDARTISAGPASVREFGDWNMCARSFSTADDAILDTLNLRKAFDPAALNARSALRLLKAVRQIQKNAGVRAA